MCILYHFILHKSTSSVIMHNKKCSVTIEVRPEGIEKVIDIC